MRYQKSQSQKTRVTGLLHPIHLGKASYLYKASLSHQYSGFLYKKGKRGKDKGTQLTGF